jgi:hypothetical protein
MGLRHDGNDPVTHTETWCPRTRVQRPNQDCVALVVPRGASIEALYHLVRVGTSDVAGPMSTLATSGAQGPRGGCRPAEAAKPKCA